MYKKATFYQDNMLIFAKNYFMQTENQKQIGLDLVIKTLSNIGENPLYINY